METRASSARRTPLCAKGAAWLRISVRGKPVDQALNILTFSPKRALASSKVLESAIANAEHNDGADIDELKVKIIYGKKAWC